METITSGEHCTQAEDEHGVNTECETHVLNTQEALHDEPVGKFFFINVQEKITFPLQIRKSDFGPFFNFALALPDYNVQGQYGEDDRADQWIGNTSFVFEHDAHAHRSVPERPPGECCQAVLCL